MPTLTRQKPVNRKSYRLLEYAAGHGRVDAKAGIVYGAKLCGLQSRNLGRTIGLDADHFGPALDRPYRYSRAGLAAAASLYEGVDIHFKHPPTTVDSEGRRTAKARGNMQKLGTVRNVAMGSDGLYGDLHLNMSHPKAKFVLESALSSPNDIALSHSAFGTPILKNGEAVIYAITAVHSVDVVTEIPATTRGLFESLDAPVLVSRKESSMAINTTLEPEAADLQTVEGFKDALSTILADAEMPAKAKLEAISALVDFSAQPVLEDYLRLKSEERARGLIESLGREATADRLAVVAKLHNEKVAKSLIESWPSKDDVRRSLRPLFSAPLIESEAEGQADSSEEFGRRLRRR